MNNHLEITRLPKKSKRGLHLEAFIKDWAVDLLAESYFDGADSFEHQWAERFWTRSGGRLRNL